MAARFSVSRDLLFGQTLTDSAGSNQGASLAAKQTGLVQSGFIRSRQISMPRLLTPITDRIEHVWAVSSSKSLDMQFILPGGTAQ